MFVYNFPGFTEKAKKQVFSQTGPKKILIGSAHERAWHQGVASRISVARIVADDDQNVTVETSDSRALCSVNGHQIKVDNEPQQLCDGDRSMEGLLLQCDLEHPHHVIMDLRHLEHTLATVVNGLHEDDHCTDKILKAIVPIKV